MSTTVLYDRPGPRTRRRVMVGGIIAGLALAVVVILMVMRLASGGQLTEEKWGPVVNPANAYFVAFWASLGTALLNNVAAAVLAMAFSLVLGTSLALMRISLPRWGRWIVVAPMEFFRGLPVVIAIFFASRILPDLGVSLPPLWYLVIGLTAYNSVIIAEIVRAGIAALPRGQSEAAAAVGLTRGQALRLILLPQAVRLMLPALISQLVVIFKDTSLGFVILYPEAVRFVAIAIQQLHNPLQLYLTAGAIFVLINYGLSKLAVWTERRLTHRGRRDAAAPAVTAPMPDEPLFAGTSAAGG